MPLSLLIYSNSRATDVKEVPRAEMHSQIAELRLLIERSHSEMMLKLTEMDGRLTRIEKNGELRSERTVEAPGSRPG